MNVMSRRLRGGWWSVIDGGMYEYLLNGGCAIVMVNHEINLIN